MSEPKREMTLIEVVDRLPKSHLARREYDAVTEKLKACEAERDSLKIELALARSASNANELHKNIEGSFREPEKSIKLR